jgi:hypothetical protein
MKNFIFHGSTWAPSTTNSPKTPLPSLSTLPNITNIMTVANCTLCTFPLTPTCKYQKSISIVTVHPCLHIFHLACFTSSAPGWPPYKCPDCGEAVGELVKEDGKPWRVQVVFPPGTTEAEAREYLRMAGVEGVEAVIADLEEFEEDPSAKGWGCEEREIDSGCTVLEVS